MGASVAAAHGQQSVDSVVVAHGLGCPVARGIFPDQGSSRTGVPCIGRQILNHCITREAP